MGLSLFLEVQAAKTKREVAAKSWSVFFISCGVLLGRKYNFRSTKHAEKAKISHLQRNIYFEIHPSQKKRLHLQTIHCGVSALLEFPLSCHDITSAALFLQYGTLGRGRHGLLIIHIYQLTNINGESQKRCSSRRFRLGCI